MKTSRNHTWLLLPVLILAAGSVFAKQYDVSECGTVIDEPGKYRLMNDLLACPFAEGGVIILASDVTLDLRGYTISCELDPAGLIPAAGVLVGWFVEGVQNVRIHNGTVTGCDDGIVIAFTDGVRVMKMNLENNIAGGITLALANNSEIKNNILMNNGTGIGSWWGGSGNLIKGNSIGFAGSAIDLNYETDSTVKCNIVGQSFFGISAGPYSTGNTLQGNLVIDGFSGIMLYGLEDPPDPILPVASGNLVKNNVAEGNFLDLSEVVYNSDTDGIYVHPDDTCRNAWMNNQFGWELGPSDCIGASVELDEDDVCALDDD